MKTIVKIQTMGLTNLNNAEYVNFMTRFSTLVEKAGTLEGQEETSALGFEIADYKVFGQDRALLSDIVAQSYTSDQTAELGTLDRQRDEMVVYLFSLLRSEKSSPIATRQMAANSLYNLLKPYMGCYRLPNQQETAQIDGMLIDLKKEEPASQVKLLGLEEVIVGLEETNGMYALLTDDRTNERAASKLEESKSVRERMSTYYDYMTTMAFVQSVAQPTDATATFVSSLNALIDETRALYNQRIGQAKAQKAKKDSL